MSRQQFMRRIRVGLRGAPAQSLAAILADYEGYFDDGMRAGRSEEELALALGDPGRLAAELRLEINARSWEAERTLGAGRRTAIAALRLAIIDLLLLVPLSIVILVCSAGLLLATGVLLAGCHVAIVGPFDDPIGGPLAAILRGIGLIAGAVAAVAALALVGIYVIDALSWYARMHRRVFQPARQSLASC